MTQVIRLTPYPGTVTYTTTKEEFVAECKVHFPEEDTPLPEGKGRCQWNGGTYVVYAETIPTRAHEMAHVVITLFAALGMDVRDSDGEAFCYMLEHLMQ